MNKILLLYVGEKVIVPYTFKCLFILQRVVVFVSAGRIGSLSGPAVHVKGGRGSVPFIWVMLQITSEMTEIYQMYNSGVGQGSKY